ncbi:hypothetical protein EVC45_23700 [Paraburkholderia sp. UYCP14C]|uniref:hypothetical protein n=1 Tax=Paraburkholderia sp. UYCP14C TaxID=2511130 RepID=UPI00101F0C55|nr:hypothetical protein [Paraburkholderia sp. UYCP14C]RZF27187.1 hypothetical protein EVC45_23700 [Paraburkholderia sp. UYCP14C]
MDFSAGDIIIEYDDSDDEAKHALIWVLDANGKTVIHSKDVGNLQGVVQQSVGALAITDDDVKYLVYRYEDSTVAAAAAWFATRWATRSDDPMVAGMVKYAATKNQVVKASVPFGRRGDEYQTEEAWTANSLVRAVRAWHRGLAGVKLSSRKGISCSQFVTYCFQAASLHAALHNMCLQSQDAKNFLLGPQNFVALKKGNRYSLIYEALKSVEKDLSGCIPPGMLVDAKTTDADNLQNCLERGDSKFKCVGAVATDNPKKPTKAWIEAAEEKSD